MEHFTMLLGQKKGRVANLWKVSSVRHL